MIGIALAAAPATGTGAGGGLMSFAPIILIFVVFYFLLIRPQQKQAKLHQKFLADLKAGTKIITKGGLHGKIIGLTDSVITLEIDQDVRVKVSREAIAGAVAAETVPNKEEKNGKKDAKKLNAS